MRVESLLLTALHFLPPEGGRNPERWEFQVRSPITGLLVLSGTGSPTASDGRTAGGANPPVPLSLTVYGVPVLFVPWGRRRRG